MRSCNADICLLYYFFPITSEAKDIGYHRKAIYYHRDANSGFALVNLNCNCHMSIDDLEELMLDGQILAFIQLNKYAHYLGG